MFILFLFLSRTHGPYITLVRRVQGYRNAYTQTTIHAVWGSLYT